MANISTEDFEKSLKNILGRESSQDKLDIIRERLSDAIANKDNNTKGYIAYLERLEKALENIVTKENEIISAQESITKRTEARERQGEHILNRIANGRDVDDKEKEIINNLTKELQHWAEVEAGLQNEKEMLIATGGGSSEGIHQLKVKIGDIEQKREDAVNNANEKANNITGIDPSDLTKAIELEKEFYENEVKRKKIGDSILRDKDDEKELAKQLKELSEESVYNAKELRDVEKENNRILQERTERYKNISQVVGFIWGQLKEGANMWMKYNTQAMGDAKALGITSKESARAYTVTMMENSRQLMREFSMTAEQAMKMQETYSNVTGRATMLSKDQMRDIAASSKLMGEDTVNSAMQILNNMGTTSDTTTELLDKNFARAKNYGLNTVKASEAFVKNLSLANKLTFKNGIDGISKMTILSQKVKMDLQEVANVADKFSSIEGAIQGSAQLQMLGGAGAMYGGNPVQMLYESMADPEALFQRMVDMASTQAVFNRKTGESTIDPLQLAIMKEQAKAMGISPENFVQSAKQQASLKDIQATSRGAYNTINSYTQDRQVREELKSTIENKATYNKEKQRWEISFDNENGQRVEGKGLNELTPEDLRAIQKDRLDPLEDIKGNVRRIASVLAPMSERWKAAQDQKLTAYAQLENGAMEKGDDILTGLNSGKGFWGEMWDSKWGAAAIGAGATGLLALMPKAWDMTVKKFISRGGTSEMEKVAKLPKGTLSTDAAVESTVADTGSFGATESVVTNTGGNLARGSRLGNIANAGRNGARNALGTKLGKGGAVISVIAGGVVAYNGWQDANSNFNRGSGLAENLAAKGRIGTDERDQRIQNLENKRTRERSEAIGEGTGTAIGGILGTIAGGAVAGMTTGALAGTVAPGVGNLIGGAVGLAVGIGMGVAGAAAGKKAGGLFGKELEDHDKDDTISKELEEINDNDADDNIKKIVLPVESIDYNVALIANQLGVLSALPARGNVYMEAEAAGENPIQAISLNEAITSRMDENGNLIQTPPIEGQHVNQIDSNITNNIHNGGGSQKVVFDFTGKVDLVYSGQNVGKISVSDFKKIIDNNPQFVTYLAQIITDKQVRRGNGGRNNHENSSNRQGTTSGTYTVR